MAKPTSPGFEDTRAANRTLGSTHWQFHPVALGDLIGKGWMQTINNGRASSPDVLTMLTIQGDPTLRTSMIAPVEISSASQNGTRALLHKS